ncbi:MAG TPA: hypothetical protein DDW65_01640 [Firmicutes bacterium]|nr:hypothetical protein [Bacillota bacterium]
MLYTQPCAVFNEHDLPLGGDYRQKKVLKVSRSKYQIYIHRIWTTKNLGPFILSEISVYKKSSNAEYNVSSSIKSIL